MHDKTVFLVTTTVRKEDQAHAIVQDLLDKRLAACIQLQPVSSHYWEENKIINNPEWHIMIKTSKDVIEELLKELLKLHPYDVPEILVHDAKANEPYSAWLENEIRLRSRYYKK